MITINRYGFSAVFGILSTFLMLGIFSSDATAYTCAERRDIALFMAVDVSESMSGVGQVAASNFGKALINELQATNYLEMTGGLFFCNYVTDQVSISSSTTDLVQLLNILYSANLSMLSCTRTDLYKHIILGSNRIRSVPNNFVRLYVVLTDGKDSNSTSSDINDALAALSTPGIVVELIHAGEGPGAVFLEYLASNAGTHVEARSKPFDQLNQIVDSIVARTCINYRPNAAFDSSPSGDLELGKPGFMKTFDGRLSSDKEDPESALKYFWTLQQGSKTFSMTGPDFIHSFSDSDIGNWQVRLRVEDTDGASDISDWHHFQVIGSKPEITLSGPTSVDALKTINITASPTTDIDGGNLNFKWEVIEAPPLSNYHGAVTQVGGAGHSLSFPTTEREITVVDGTNKGHLRFRCTATDNEGETDTEEWSVDVINLPPKIKFNGLTEIDVGEAIEVETTELRDPDGPFSPDPSEMTFTWDLIQSPDSANIFPTYDFQTGPELYIQTDHTYAGTWIFRLRVTDNEGETVEDEFTVLVDGPVEAIINKGKPYRTIEQHNNIIDGGNSEDADSPNCIILWGQCHSTLDGRAVVISPGIVKYNWSLIEVPMEHQGTYWTGLVSDTLNLPAHNVNIHIPAYTLKTGRWVFQLEVIDGEDNSDFTTFAVEMGHMDSPPTAIVGSPAYYLTNSNGETMLPIEVNGIYSYDFDNIFSTGYYSPGLGISQWAWTSLLAPPACGLPLDGLGTTRTLIGAGLPVPSGCFGMFDLQLTVTDDDGSGLTSTNNQWFIISDCNGMVCIDAPTETNPEYVEFSDKTDITIAYHLNSAIYTTSLCSQGCYAQLVISHENDPTTPVFVAYEPNPLGTDLGGQHFFKWNGYVLDGSTDSYVRPAKGRYNVTINVLDYAFSCSDPITFSDSQPNSIYIEVSNIEINPGADTYLSLNNAEAGLDTLSAYYTISGYIPVTEIALLIYHEGEATPLLEIPQTASSSGEISWNGEITGGNYLEPGHYEFAIRAMSSTGVLDESERQPFVAYRIDLEWPGVDASTEDTPGITLQYGDTNYQASIILQPTGLEGSIYIEEIGSNALLGISPSGDWSLPKTADIPASSASVSANIEFRINELHLPSIELSAVYLPPGVDSIQKEARDSVTIMPVNLEASLASSYIDLETLTSGNTQLEIHYEYQGTAVLDSIHLQIFDSNQILQYKQTLGNSPTGDAFWNGDIGGGIIAPVGQYTVEISADSSSGPITDALSLPFTLYQLTITLAGGVVEKSAPGIYIPVNNDDDNANGKRDFTEIIGFEDDFVEATISIEPPIVENVTLSILGSSQGVNIWDDPLKYNTVATFDVSSDPSPWTVYFEGLVADEYSLIVTCETPDGDSFSPEPWTLTVFSVEIMKDTHGANALHGIEGDMVITEDDLSDDHVEIGLWDFAFETIVAVPPNYVDALLNNNDAVSIAASPPGSPNPQNFIGRDSRRFYFRVTDASAPPHIISEKFEWLTETINMTPDDLPPTNATQRLLETGSNTHVYTSVALMLVTTEIDQKQTTNNGLAGTYGSNAAYDTVDHRTRLVNSIDGYVAARYSPAGPGGPTFNLRWPVFDRLPDERRYIVIHVYNFSDNYGHDFIPESYIEEEIDLLKRLYWNVGIQANVTYDPTHNNLKLPATSAVDLTKIEYYDSTSSPTSAVTELMNAAAYAYNPAYPIYAYCENVLFILYVHGFSIENILGFACPDTNLTPGSIIGRNFAVVNGVKGFSITPTHEIGHLLTNQKVTGEATDGTTKPGWRNKWHFGGTNQRQNLMKGTGAIKPPITPKHGLRLWNDAAVHIVKQHDLILDTRYIKQ